METTVLLGTLSAIDLLFAYVSHLSPVQRKEAQLDADEGVGPCQE